MLHYFKGLKPGAEDCGIEKYYIIQQETTIHYMLLYHLEQICEKSKGENTQGMPLL